MNYSLRDDTFRYNHVGDVVIGAEGHTGPIVSDYLRCDDEASLHAYILETYISTPQRLQKKEKLIAYYISLLALRSFLF